MVNKRFTLLAMTNDAVTESISKKKKRAEGLVKRETY